MLDFQRNSTLEDNKNHTFKENGIKWVCNRKYFCNLTSFNLRIFYEQLNDILCRSYKSMIFLLKNATYLNINFFCIHCLWFSSVRLNIRLNCKCNWRKNPLNCPIKNISKERVFHYGRNYSLKRENKKKKKTGQSQKNERLTKLNCVDSIKTAS